MRKFGFSLLMATGLILIPLWAAHADFKVGIVDGMDIISKSAAGKAAQENLKKKSEDLRRPAESRQKDISKMMADFEKQAPVMKEDARKRKEEEINKKVEDLRKTGADAEKAFAQAQEKELAPLLQKLDSAVKAVAQESKFDLVLDKRGSGLLFVSPSLEITDKVRAKFGQ